MPQSSFDHPPFSVEAETTVLGSILIDAEAMIDVRRLLKPEDFYDATHRAIYSAMTALYDAREPIDFVTVSEALRGNDRIEGLGGAAFLAELTQSVPTSSHAMSYAQIVREKSLRRQLERLAHRLAATAHDGKGSAAELLEQTEREFLQLSQSSASKEPISLADMRSERFDRYAALYEADDPSLLMGTRTGFKELDDLLTAMAPGHLIVLAGRPSMGKTALALDIARDVGLEQGKNVAIFSLEMTKEEIFDRIFGSLTGIQPWKLTKGLLTEEQFLDMGPSFDRLDGQRIFIDDDPDRTLVTIRSKARRLQLQHPLDLVVIDYLQLIQVNDRPANENQTQKLTFISESMKQLARELHCPVLALSQLNRETERRPDKRPQLSDLRDSGSIEQDADRVLMIYRDSYYNEDTAEPELTDLFVRKNRHGPIGQVQLRFDAHTTSFRSIRKNSATSQIDSSQPIPTF